MGLEGILRSREAFEGGTAATYIICLLTVLDSCYSYPTYLTSKLKTHRNFSQVSKSACIVT